MVELFRKYYQFIFLLTIWAIFSSPYLIFGKVPYSSTYQVNHFPPWTAYEKYWGPVKNGAMPDITDQIYPWRHFTIESLKKSQIPLWNPYNFSGNPHLANFQSAVLSPFNLLFFILPFVDAWSLNVLLAPLLAGIFTYFLLREFGNGKNSSLISAISFMFCGFITVWMAYGTLSLAIAFLPLSLFCLEKWFNTKKTWALALLAFSIPLSFFAGHFQTSLYFFIFLAFYLIFKIINSKSKKGVLSVFLSVLFGLLIILPQIVPSIEFYYNTVRSQVFNSGGGIPWWHLVTFFSPDFFGNPVTRNDWIGSYAEWANFIGIIPFALILFSVFSVKKKSRVWFFILAGITTLILAIESPLQPFIGNLKIPVLSTSNPSRIIVLASFCFSVLAGFGLESLLEFINKKSLKKIITGFFPTFLILASVWIFIYFTHILSAEQLIVVKRNMVLPTIMFGLVFGAAILFSFFNIKKYLWAFIVIVLVVTSFDSLRFAQKWMPFDPKNLVFANIPVFSGIKENIGYGRIFGNLGAQVETYYGYPSIQGYDPLYVGRYGEFIRSALSGEFLEGERSVVKLEKFGAGTKRVLDVLGVTLIFHPVADTNQSWAFPVWRDSRYIKVYGDNKFQLFKNTSALPRAELFNRFELIHNDKQTLKRFYSNSFDFRKTIIVEENPNIVLNKEAKGKSEIISYTPNKIIIKENTDSPALLFLSDNYYPGWEAFIDGSQTKIFRADYAFRAVVVPKGTHTVIFNYSPLSFKLGIVGAIIGLIGLVILLIKK